MSAFGSKSVWNELKTSSPVHPNMKKINATSQSNYPTWRLTHWPHWPAAWSHFHCLQCSARKKQTTTKFQCSKSSLPVHKGMFFYLPHKGKFLYFNSITMWKGKHFQKCDWCKFVFIQAVSATHGTTSEAYYIHTNNRKNLRKYRSLDAPSLSYAPFCFLRWTTKNEAWTCPIESTYF